ncbi:MAG TPA: F0F1 ATP synthase subunit epsilon [Verrucomicrobiota bacterium]|nr:F0F1 ATP synthase subunit epsilon [Verrucomicrobiota bacterium]
MSSKLKLEIVTPEAIILSEDVEMVTLPGVEGELGIYPMHIPLMTQIVPGELRFIKDGEERLMAVGEGFVEITGDKISILTDMAIEAKDIDEAKALDAQKRAEARLKEKISDEEAAAAQAAIARSVVQLQIKRKVKR